MILLADWKLEEGSDEPRIELYWGDLSYLGPKHAVDVLVVSAFRNDYIPTPTSLIGALSRNGISVHDLSFAKEIDLREEFSCWLSAPLIGVSSFQRILCIESGWRGTPPEIADDLFRAIAPCSVAVFPKRSVAMPLIGAGDQGYAPDQILESVLRAAVAWFGRGMQISVLKIVTYSSDAANMAQKRFLEIKHEHANDSAGVRDFDVFLSYAHEDSGTAQLIVESVHRSRPSTKVFYDKHTLTPGSSWLMGIAHALDASRRVLTLYTPRYWESVPCQDEFAAGYVRHSNEKRRVLFPIYFREARIPSFFAAMQYADCREADLGRLEQACRNICAELSNG